MYQIISCLYKWICPPTVPKIWPFTTHVHITIAKNSYINNKLTCFHWTCTDFSFKRPFSFFILTDSLLKNRWNKFKREMPSVITEHVFSAWKPQITGLFTEQVLCFCSSFVSIILHAVLCFLFFFFLPSLQM